MKRPDLTPDQWMLLNILSSPKPRCSFKTNLDDLDALRCTGMIDRNRDGLFYATTNGEAWARQYRKEFAESCSVAFKDTEPA